MTPNDQYVAAIERGELQKDPAQARAVAALDALYHAIDRASSQTAPNPSKPSFFGRLLGRREAPAELVPLTGLYIWGGVGRGKTHLVDLFFDALPEPRKQRLHFHRFMRWVHDELKTLKAVESPLDIVAERLSERCRILCLDEMHVNDITDAMLMHGLLSGLFSRGVTLVTTSNVPPDGLYKDGLQRARFLPAIELMKQHTEVLHLDSEVDYRLRALEQAEIYHHPLDDAALVSLEKSYHAIAAVEHQHADAEAHSVQINDRAIECVRWDEGIVWFDFDALCNTPRSTHDYIEIACCFHTVLLSNLPVMDDMRNDEARRFVNLIDEFYDRNVKLIISAEVGPEQLYAGKRLAFEFQRCVSRLKEMQSHEYLAQPHLP